MSNKKDEATASERRLNFWEARQAAKQGKTVRMVGHPLPKGISPESMLKCTAWMTESIEAEWEIVAEPTQEKWTFKPGPNKLDIEFVYETATGKLISARNVDTNR